MPKIHIGGKKLSEIGEIKDMLKSKYNISDGDKDAIVKQIFKGEVIVEEKDGTTRKIGEVVAKHKTKDDPVQVDYESMTKRELEEYTLENFGVDLDLRKTKKDLIKEIKKLEKK